MSYSTKVLVKSYSPVPADVPFDSLKDCVLDIIAVGKTDILNAMDFEMPDYEDALAAQCAKRLKAEYIVTRNSTDFVNSPVPTAEPADFLMQFK